MGSFLALADGSIHLAPAPAKRPSSMWAHLNRWRPIGGAGSWCISWETKLKAVQIFRAACRGIVHKQSWVHVSAQCFSPHIRASKMAANSPQHKFSHCWSSWSVARRHKLFGHKSSQNLSLFHHLQDLSYRNRCSWKYQGEQCILHSNRRAGHQSQRDELLGVLRCDWTSSHLHLVAWSVQVEGVP